MVILNHKSYFDEPEFEKEYIEEYCNLEIYPKAGIIEIEAGLMSDFAEAFKQEGLPVRCVLYGDLNSETQFFRDSLLHFTKESNIFLAYMHESYKEIYIKPHKVLLANEHEYFNSIYPKRIKIHKLEKVLYLTKHGFDIFQRYFERYYPFKNGIWQYSNLVCYTMIVKDAGPMLEEVLTNNLPFIDRWCILDTGSTDGTQEIINKVLLGKKGKLYTEPFVNFKVSRNRCLDLAGQSCKFIIMLDDTYSLQVDVRNFLETVRGDQFSDSFSLLIKSDDSEYYSNRIIKSKTKLRYIHTIHEVITAENNVNVTIPANKAWVLDNRSEYMHQRTMERKQFDLTLLFQELEDYPDDPRSLYYIAQTYGCIGDEIHKAEFFEKRIRHPVQGYIQEKIDALFELARTYNFKVSPITKEYYSSEKISAQEWDIVEGLYLQAYSLDTSRPDALYFIGIRYYLQSLFEIAYHYFKRAFKLGYPVDSQYSLKPTLSFHYLPKFLTEVCYYLHDFQLGLAASELYISKNERSHYMENWNRIHSGLLKLNLQVPKSMDLPIFCFVTDGGWEPWTGSDIETKGLGGSETWIIEMARYISRTGKYHVVVFCKTNEPQFYENVGYNPIEMFYSFNYTMEYCIISRYTEYIPVAIHHHCKNIGLIFHDNLTPELVIPQSPKLKWVFGLTEWHSQCIKKVFPQFNVSNIYYGVNDIPQNKKIKNSFIYSSFPNRGLVILLRMWKSIIEVLPDATLNVFCDLEHPWSNDNYPEQLQEIKMNIHQPGITNYNWVPKSELYIHFSKSEFWLYPCIFEETFCLTALEAAISKTKVITNGLAGLSETAKYGITISGDPYSEQWQSEVLNILKNVEIPVEDNYSFAKNLTWESQAIKFMDYLKC